MKKYITVFKSSFQDQIVYRLNFIIWRLRNVLRVLMVFFLWRMIFVAQNSVFGYTSSQINSYILLSIIVLAFVWSSPSNEQVATQISNGELSNYLLKPINYMGYWLSRDWSNKLLNLIFSIGEVSIFILLFRPNITTTFGLMNTIAGIVLILISSMIYFWVGKIAHYSTFWMPENTWGMMFFVLVLVELFSGMLFPLNILPGYLYNLIQLLPFPYMVYFPVQILLGKIIGFEAIKIILQAVMMLFLSWWISRVIWKKGLRQYTADGR